MFDDFTTQIQSDELIPSEWDADYDKNPIGFALGMFALTKAICDKKEKNLNEKF